MPSDSPRDDGRQSAPSDCPDCGRPLPDGSVLCVNCGFDFRTGRRLQTTIVRADDEPPEETGDDEAPEIIKTYYCPRCSGIRREHALVCDECLDKLSARKRALRTAAGTGPVARLCPYCSDTLLPKESVCIECADPNLRTGIVSAVFPHCTVCRKMLDRGVVVCPACGADLAY